MDYMVRQMKVCKNFRYYQKNNGMASVFVSCRGIIKTILTRLKRRRQELNEINIMECQWTESMCDERI